MQRPERYHHDRPGPRAAILFALLCVDFLWIVALSSMATLTPHCTAQETTFRSAIDAVSIRLRFNMVEDDHEVRITDPAELARFENLLCFQVKSPCLCVHCSFIYFEAVAETTWADVCGHCFNLHSGDTVQYFRMRRELADLIVSHVPGRDGSDRRDF